MKKISTGQPSILKTFREIAYRLSGKDETNPAVKHFDKRIEEAPHGENEEVIADEKEVLKIIVSLLREGN